MQDNTNDPNWDDLLAPWHSEGASLVPERDFTPWAHPGWLSWNEHAVEVEVAAFLADLVTHVVSRTRTGHPNDWGATVVETGTGQGFVTRRIAERMNFDVDSLLCFESDPAWRNAMFDRNNMYGFFESVDSRELGPFLSPLPTPLADAYQQADLMILDSMDPFRMGEICLWAGLAKPGSYLFVHDAGGDHPSWDGHYTLGQLIRTLKLPGLWLENPRGAFIARQGYVRPEEQVVSLWGRILERVYTRSHD